MIAGTLEIDLIANMARLSKDMADAQKTVGGAMESIEKTVEMAKTALEALALVEVVKMFGEHVKGAIEAADATNKMSQKIGVASDELQKFQYMASLSDVSAEGMANGFKKLSVSMADGNQEAAMAFQALGISTRDTNGHLRDSESVMEDVADHFSKMQDGVSKTALAVKLFGKAGADMIPLLNGGRDALRESSEEAQKFGLILSKETLAQAEEFNDSLTKLSAISEGVFKQVAAAALPALNALTQALIESATAADSINQQAQKLRKDGTLQEWAVDTVRFLGFVIDAGQGIYRIFEVIGAAIGALAAAEASIFSGDFKSAKSIISNLGDDIDAILNRKLFSATLNEKLSQINKAISENNGGKSTAGNIDLSTTLGQYDKLISQIKEKISLQNAEANSLIPLTEAEKFAIKIRSDLESGTIKLTDAQKENVNTLLDGYIASEKYAKSQQDAIKFAKELSQEILKQQSALDQMVLQQQRTIEGAGQGRETRDLASAMNQIMDRYTSQRQALEAQQLQLAMEGKISDQTAAEYAKRLDLIDEFETKSLDSYTNYYKELQKQQGDWSVGASEAINNYLDDSKNVSKQVEDTFSDAFKGLEDALTTFIQTGKFSFSDLANSILADIARMEARAAISKIFGSSSGSGGGSWWQAAINAYSENSGGGNAGGSSGGGGIASAKGNIFLDGSVVRAFANGGAFTNGIATGPTVAPMALFGEAGPEAIMPLTRGADGSLGVKSSGSGTSVQYSPVIHIDSRTDRAQVQSLVLNAVKQGNADLVEKLQRAGKL